jgi:hypothetical protein
MRITSLCVVTFFLSACGGGLQEEFGLRLDQSIKSGPVKSAKTDPSLAQLHFSVFASSGRLNTASITPDQLFDWAEENYPGLFPTKENTSEWGTYEFRYYGGTDIYLAVEGGKNVVVLGKPTGDVLVQLGDLSAFETQVHQNPVPGTLYFKYNLDQSLPDEWISEFSDVIKDLQRVMPISQNAQTIAPNSVLNIYAWNGEIKNPFNEKPGMSGACICGDGNTSWMVLEIPPNEFKDNQTHRYSVIVHEYFHLYQKALSNGSIEGVKWLSEGGAKVIEEIYVKEHYGKSSLTSDLMSPFLYTLENVLSNPSLFEQYETSSGKDVLGAWIDMNYAGSAYMVLALVKELQKNNLSEQKAFELIFKDFWVEKAKRTKWTEAFKEVFKMSVEEFYARLGDHAKDLNQLLPSESLKIQDIFLSEYKG